MGLILTVVSYRGQPPAEPRSAMFDESGGTLGRGAGVKLDLPDPERIVSSKHAEIYFENGRYFVTDTSTNGLYINQSKRPLGRGNSIRLESGDQLIVGEYVVRVSLEEAAVAAAPPVAPPPVAPPPDFGLSDARPTPSSLDPLEGLGKPERRQNPLTGSPVTPPEVIPGSQGLPPQGAKLIPDDFASELLGKRPGPDPQGAPQAQGAPHADSSAMLSGYFEPPKAVSEAIPKDWSGTVEDDAPATPKPAGPKPVGPVGGPQPTPPIQPPQTPVPPPVGGGATGPAAIPPLVGPDVGPDASAGAPPLAPAPAPAPAPGPAGSGDLALLRALLEGAGLEGLRISDEALPEVAAVAGQILREAIKGTIDILADRVNFKSEFRLDVTRIRPAENNPLKFAASVDEALGQLLTGRGTGMLAPTDAVRQAFDDVRAHQLAVMAGISAALKALLARLDPQTLEQGFGKSGVLDAMLPAARKAKCWDCFVEEYKEIAADAEEGFRSLFADEFASAYDRQMERLRRARGGTGG